MREKTQKQTLSDLSNGVSEDVITDIAGLQNCFARNIIQNAKSLNAVNRSRTKAGSSPLPSNGEIIKSDY